MCSHKRPTLNGQPYPWRRSVQPPSFLSFSHPGGPLLVPSFLAPVLSSVALCSIRCHLSTHFLSRALGSRSVPATAEMRSLAARPIPLALAAMPLLVSCAPWDLEHAQEGMVVTETLTSTVVQTAPASASPAVSPGTPDGIFMLPGGVPIQINGLPPAQPSATSPSQASAASQAPTTSGEPSSTSATQAPPSLSSSSTPASSSSAPTSTSTSLSFATPTPAPRPQMMAYYPDWAAPAYPPEKIDFARFDWIDYAFAVPDAQYNLTWDGSADGGGLLARLVDAAHRAGTKVKLSVGGWTGSQYFSPAVADDASRQTFVQNILATYEQYGLDGIDIDWEYPGQAGDTGNAVDPRDTANFLAFLQQLRAALPQGAALSAAAQTAPFADTQGAPAHNVSAFAAVLDWVLIMNYDAFGSSAAPGPNAPLDDACGNSTQPAQNAAAALAAWTAAGVPAAQLVLGVPSYGYVSRSDATRLRTRAPPAGAQIYATSEDGSTDAGQVQFRGLVAQGVLQYAPLGANGTDGASGAGAGNGTDLGAPPTRVEIPGGELQSLYAGWSGFERYWDACSSTPFLRSEGAEQVVTYDDPLSLGLKAAFAREQGMRGVNLFDVSGDTDQWDLTDGCRRGLGLPV